MTLLRSLLKRSIVTSKGSLSNPPIRRRARLDEALDVLRVYFRAAGLPLAPRWVRRYWYHDALGRLPKVVGGTVHLLNSHYSNNNGLGVDIRASAKLVVERTVHENTKMPHRHGDTSGVSLLGPSRYLSTSATTPANFRETGGGDLRPIAIVCVRPNRRRREQGGCAERPRAG